MISRRRTKAKPRRFSEHLTPIEKPPRPDVMSPAELTAAMSKLVLSQAALARLTGVGDRQVRRWVAGDAPIPPLLERFLRYMIRAKVSPRDVMELTAFPER